MGAVIFRRAGRRRTLRLQRTAACITGDRRPHRPAPPPSRLVYAEPLLSG